MHLQLFFWMELRLQPSGAAVQTTADHKTEISSIPFFHLVLISLLYTP